MLLMVVMDSLMCNCTSELVLRTPRNDGAQMGEGPGVFAPSPSFIRYQPACKPGSVGHRPLARTIRDGHSSGTMFAHGLEQPTRTASLTLPCGVIAFANSPRCRPYSVLLPVWFAMPFPLPDTRCALTAPFHPCCPSLSGGGAVHSLWHFPWGCPRRMLSGTVCRWSPDFPPPQPFDHSRSGRPAD